MSWIEELVSSLEGVEYTYSAVAQAMIGTTPGHRIPHKFNGSFEGWGS